MSLNGIGDVANIGTLSNSGAVYVGLGATLNLTDQSGGLTDVPLYASFTILGSFNAGGNSSFVNLTSVEGAVELANGQTTNITPNAGTLAIIGRYPPMPPSIVVTARRKGAWTSAAHQLSTSTAM